MSYRSPEWTGWSLHSKLSLYQRSRNTSSSAMGLRGLHKHSINEWISKLQGYWLLLQRPSAPVPSTCTCKLDDAYTLNVTYTKPTYFIQAPWDYNVSAVNPWINEPERLSVFSLAGHDFRKFKAPFVITLSFTVEQQQVRSCHWSAVSFDYTLIPPPHFPLNSPLNLLNSPIKIKTLTLTLALTLNNNISNTCSMSFKYGSDSQDSINSMVTVLRGPWTLKFNRVCFN